MTGHQPLKGQKALVTGANSGIGAGVAQTLAAAEADDGGMTLHPEFARGG